MSTGIAPLTPQQAAAQEQKAAAEAYPKRLLIALDMFINVLTDGDPDETISSRAARAAQQGKGWGSRCPALPRPLPKGSRRQGSSRRYGSGRGCGCDRASVGRFGRERKVTCHTQFT